jgi:hypothetical protein
MTFIDDVGGFFKDDVYGGFLKPVGEGVYNQFNRNVDRLNTAADSGLNFFQKMADNLSSPWMMYVAIAVGGLVLISVLKK